MTLRERCYRTACRIFRQEIIRDGFRGILGREPEEEALRAYSETLPGIGMEGLMTELSNSKESWEKQKASHAEELIRAAYQGVLGRNPEDKALRAYEGSFREIGPEGIIRELNGSLESWEKQKLAHAEELIRAAYQGVLWRKPEEEALRAYEESFRDLGTEGLIRDLVESDEHWEKIEIRKASEGKMSKWIEWTRNS